METEKLQLPKGIGQQIIVLFSIIIGLAKNWDWATIALFVLLVWVFIQKWSSRHIFRLSLALFVLIPLSLVFKRYQHAESIAIFSFYFLLLSLCQAMNEFRDVDEASNIVQESDEI